MIIRRFLAWTQHASATHRAEATAALAKAYLYGDLSEADAWEAKTALLALLDDPSPVVRRALAETCAPSARAPRPLIVALSCDVPEVAGPVLAASPVLTDADLVDAAALGCEAMRAVIAGRHHLSPAVSGALAEIGDRETLVAMAGNPTARITAGRLLRMVERCGDAPALREALLARPDLPLEVRHAIALVLADTLSNFVARCGWLGHGRCERMNHEAGERIALDLCDGSGAAAVGRLVRHLRTSRQLNAGLILRAVLSGRADFTEAALVELSGLDHAAVARAMREPKGVAELHRRSGLPEALLPAMQAALSAWREAAGGAPASRSAGLSRRMIERAIAACQDMPALEVRAVTALLGRYETEAARDEAREAARAIVAEAARRDAARREAAAADAAWRDALAIQRRPVFAATEVETVPIAIEAGAPADEPAAGTRAVVAVAPAPVPDAPGEEATARGGVVCEGTGAAAPATEAAAATEVAPGSEQQASGHPASEAAFNPVGAILDTLPDQLLERFFAGRERGREGAPPEAEATGGMDLDAVLDGLGAGLLEEYRTARGEDAHASDDLLKIAA